VVRAREPDERLHRVVAVELGELGARARDAEAVSDDVDRRVAVYARTSPTNHSSWSRISGCVDVSSRKVTDHSASPR
jgi:hypothetical protein